MAANVADKKAITFEEIMQTLEKYGRNDRLVREYSEQDAVVVEDAVTNGNGDQEIRSRSTSTSYKEEWQWLFEREDYLRVIRCEGIRGRLRSSRFRSVCWKVYLECLPEDKSEWLATVRIWRTKYEGLREKHITNPHKKNSSKSPDPVLHHPLSQEKDSLWNKYFEDTELRQLVKQDVTRTFPEIQFFQSEDVRTMMIDMLFCYAREHQAISYKQGMHELLAPMIFVLHCDHQAFIHAQEIESQLDDVTEILDPTYLEHDAYCMFSQLMETMEPCYRHGRDDYRMSRARDKFDKPLFKSPDEYAPSTPIVLRLTRIQEVILKGQDVQLYQHLNRLEIKPQIYGIRWVRLLFGREVIIQDLLVLWDAIFSDSATLDLVDYIFVAMLVLVRELLITSDYAKCMTLLMRFPPIGDVHFLINKALHLRDPSKYARPANYQFQMLSNLQSGRAAASQNGRQIQNIKNKTTAVVTSGFNSLKRITAKGRVADKKVQKSKSDPSDLSEGTPHPLGGSSDGIAVTVRPLDTAKPKSTKGATVPRAPTQMSALTPEGTPVDETPAPVAKSTPPMKVKSKKNHTKDDYEHLEQDVRQLQGRLNDMQALRRYCATKMEAHLMQMQDELLKHGNDGTEDDLLLSIAGLKQVKDILNGTLKFSQGLTDDDTEININENHYGGPGTRITSIRHSDESRETSIEDSATPSENDFAGDVGYTSSNTDDFSLNSNQNSNSCLNDDCVDDDGVSDQVDVEELGDEEAVEIVGGILSFADDIASSRSDAPNFERTSLWN